MKHALEPLGKRLIFSPCCKTSPVGIEWLKKPSIDELDADDYTVQRCDESAGWWMGDVIAKRHEIEGAGMSLREFAIKYAQARGLNEETVIARANVSAFFPVCNRLHRPITWTQHLMVCRYRGGEGLKVCLEWLKRAEKEGWSGGRLRQELGKDTRSKIEPNEPTPPAWDFEEATIFDSWASSELSFVDKMEEAKARRLLASLSCTAALIAALHRRLGTGKESFTGTHAQR